MARFSLSYNDIKANPAIAAGLQTSITDVLPTANFTNGNQTAAIRQAMDTFATLNGISGFDGSVNMAMWGQLTKKASPASLRNVQTSALPVWMKKIAAYNTAKRIDLPEMITDDFLDAYAEEFRIYLPPNNRWRANLTTFLDYIRADTAMTDIRWVAYMLATVMHECRRGADGWKAYWLPIAETRGGINRDKEYWNEVVVRNKAGKALDASGQVIENERTGANRMIRRAYYGRGFLQITWQENYRKMDNVLGLGGTLHINPELTIENAQVSYNITSYGMRNGCFIDDRAEPANRADVCGGAKLADYIHDGTTDYVRARRIINTDGRTNGNLVAGYARTFEELIKAASVVMIAPEPRP